MEYYLKCKKVDTAIRRTKSILITKVKAKGMYENFGQEEIRKIKDRFIDITDYSEEMNKVRSEICLFENWCMTYTGI
jgi:hypothetical protein